MVIGVCASSVSDLVLWFIHNLSLLLAWTDMHWSLQKMRTLESELLKSKEAEATVISTLNEWKDKVGYQDQTIKELLEKEVNF